MLGVASSRWIFAPLAVTAFLSASFPAAAQQLRLSSAPVLTLSGAADSNAQFTGIAGLARLSNGDIVVAQGSPAELRLFSQDGRFVRRLARAGSGPGEVMLPWWLGRAGDSLLLSDLALARITVFDRKRDEISTISFAPRGAPSRMVVAGHFVSGRWLVVTLPRVISQQHGEGPFRDSATVGYWSGDTATVHIIGTFPNFAYFGYTDARVGASGAGLDRLFPISSFVVVNDDLWIADPESEELLVYNAVGALRQRVRVPLPRTPWSKAPLNRARERVLSTTKRAPDSARVAAMFDLGRRPARAPAFSRLIPGVNGAVWLEAYRVGRDEATDYVAIDAKGRVSGQFHGPPAVRFFDIGADYALGVHRDSDDVDTVVLYRILR
jgi:hypothetical protein